MQLILMSALLAIIFNTTNLRPAMVHFQNHASPTCCFFDSDIPPPILRPPPPLPPTHPNPRSSLAPRPQIDVLSRRKFFVDRSCIILILLVVLASRSCAVCSASLDVPHYLKLPGPLSQIERYTKPHRSCHIKKYQNVVNNCSC